MTSPVVQTAWSNPHRLCVAPMLDWTDRHFRFFHRLLAPHALLYTEMITTGAILHGDLPRLLDFDPAEHPVALQIGGSEPQDLARAAKIGADWGYDEINLNCGCPSERVQKGAFGACLMKEPGLVADGIKAMQDSVSVPVTVKHRIGVDDQNDYGFVRDFVGQLYAVGCRVFIVHARGAILKGLSPKENREIPPLRWSVVRALKQDFPEAVVVANGGISQRDQADDFLRDSDEGPAVDGVMLGRAAYHDPWLLRDLDARWFADGPRASARPAQREDVVAALDRYLTHRIGPAQSAKSMARHWHGLFHGQPGARAWRRAMCEGQSPLSVWRRDPAAAA
ncbi:MAG: tRNA dihydrouridine(20/20a) synthase DusA [Burkholderiaceae bacterium]